MIHDPWPTHGDVLAYPYYNHQHGRWLYVYEVPNPSTGGVVYAANWEHIRDTDID